jgi:hypothetical protein
MTRASGAGTFRNSEKSGIPTFILASTWCTTERTASQLEYDFVVAAHANADRIAFSIAELESGRHVREDEAGDLVIPMGEKEVRLHKPRIYQGNSCSHGSSSGVTTIAGSCKLIAGGRFRLHQRGSSEAQVAFELPAYDHSQALIVDPVVSFSTFLGGDLIDEAEGIAVDATGNIYLIGITSSTNFPLTSNPLQSALAGDTDAFVTKLSGDGSQLIFSTYLGGSGGEFPHGIAVDSSGSAYLTGETYSTDFPLVNAYQSQNRSGSGFVSKLSPDGSTLVFSTFLGGSVEGSTNGIAVDSNGEAIVAGRTYALDFPVVNAFQSAHASDSGNEDAFVTKFSADGSSLLFSTYLGGDADDTAQGIAVDGSGNIYVGGMTSSNDFPITPGSFQTTYSPNPPESSFVSAFSPTGTLLYSTYLAASEIFAIAASASGSAFVTGSATIYLPVTAGAFQTVGGGAFVTEFNGTGSSLVYSTFLGGNGISNGNAIAVDSAGNAYVTGEASALNFPLQYPVQSALIEDVPGAFVSEFNSTGSHLLFSTYLGGGAGYGSQQGNAIAVDSSGNIYAAGSTLEPNFPVFNAMQPTLDGAENAFVAKFLNQPAPAISLSLSTLSFAPEVVGVASPPQAVTLTNVGAAPLTASIGASGDFSETNTCASGVAPQAACTIQIAFIPTVSGSETGQLSISSNATLVPDAVQLSGTGQDFVLQGSPGTSTVSAGQNATYSISLMPQGGFAQMVSFSCSGAQNSTCTISPASVTLDGTDNGSATLTLATTGSSTALAVRPGYLAGGLSGPREAYGASELRNSLLFWTACLVIVSGRQTKKSTGWLPSLVVLILFLTACGGGGPSGGSGAGGGGGSGGSATPPGTYTITVTASTVGGLNHATEFTLTVN